jgi:hypothetical protein
LLLEIREPDIANFDRNRRPEQSKAYAPRFAASGMQPSKKNAKAIILALFRRCGKP